MALKTWQRLLEWRLSGGRYDAKDHKGIELSDLAALVQLREVLLELAKGIWKQKHGRTRIPDHVEQDVDLRVEAFSSGSVVTTIWLGVPPPAQAVLFNADPDLARRDDFFLCFHDAAAILQRWLLTRELPDVPGFAPGAFAPIATLAQEHDLAFTLAAFGRVPTPDAEASPRAIDADVEDGDDPDDPRTFVRSADPRDTSVRWTEDQAARVAARTARPPDDYDTYVPESDDGEPAQEPQPKAVATPAAPAVIDNTATWLLQQAAERTAADEQRRIAETRVERRTIAGEVTMVELGGRARIRLDDGEQDIEIHFSPEDEKTMTSALDQHRSLRVRARGEATLDSRGKVRSFRASKVKVVAAPTPDDPGEVLFAQLATQDSPRLLAFLSSSTLSPGLLARAAEIAGAGLAADDVIPSLLRLLHHSAAVVREGAIYGLLHHDLSAHPTVRSQLEELARHDPNPGVRLVAEGASKR